jgi:hypothetical protein
MPLCKPLLVGGLHSHGGLVRMQLAPGSRCARQQPLFGGKPREYIAYNR